jgi:two-component system nitrate/nitrite response regulator NarL
MKLLVVDDHPLVIEGLIGILSSESIIGSVEQATSKDGAEKKIMEQNPDIVLLDIRLGKENGLDIIPRIREEEKECKFIILTSSLYSDDFARAESLDVDGYILKHAYPEEILLRIKMVSRGRKYYDPGIMEMILNERDMLMGDNLTAREQDVLKELGKGSSNKEIAENLFITEYTVKKHVSRILTKLGLSDRTQAALYVNNHHIM